MRRFLISFLGRGRKESSAVTPATRSGYQSTSYDFGRGHIRETTIFGVALWEFLCQSNRRPDGWLILGTEQSLWSALGDALPQEVYDAVYEWLDRVDTYREGRLVTPADLAAVPPEVARALDVPELHLELIGRGADRTSQEALADVLLRHLRQDDRVILDITHAFRHLPVVVAFILSAMRWLRGVTVETIYYGALEMTDPKTGLAPVIDLSLCAEYAEKAAALATCHLTGQYRALAAQFPDLAEKIDCVAFREDVNRLHEAEAEARQLVQALEAVPESPAFQHQIARVLRSSLGWVQKLALPQQMAAKSRFFFARGDYVKAVTLAAEAVLMHAGLMSGTAKQLHKYEEYQRERARTWLREQLPKPQRQRLDLLFSLRNAIVHGSRPWGKEAKRALQSREALEKALGECLDFAAALVESRLDLREPEGPPADEPPAEAG